MIIIIFDFVSVTNDELQGVLDELDNSDMEDVDDDAEETNLIPWNVRAHLDEENWSDNTEDDPDYVPGESESSSDESEPEPSTSTNKPKRKALK